MSDRTILTLTNLNRFSLLETRNFFSTVRNVLMSIFEEPPKVAEDLLNAVSDFENAMNREDLESGVIQEADKQADNAWMALNAQLKAMLISMNTERREAAERIDQFFSLYENPTRLPYDKEYAIIAKQLNDLDNCDIKDLEVTYLQEPIQYLKQAYDNYQKVVTNRLEAKAQIIIGENKTKKLALIDAWRKFVNRCNVMAEWQNDVQLIEFIQQINIAIAQKNAVYLSNKKKKSNKEENV